ncbi:hypothetical protein [Nocardioides currus]|uniref:hypothetical protein n=1 Tax=Nocardioides currus TaxID=2133958 RepID=UPI001A9C7B4A|nr:hypothetical protein [Nocardioides currus]
MTDGLCLDAGALIGVERADARVVHLLHRAHAMGATVEIPTGVVAQVWRGGRQARLARFLRADHVTLVELDADTARAVGVMCGRSGVSDVVDGHVALHARRRRLSVLTSDPDDISAFDPTLSIIAI